MNCLITGCNGFVGKWLTNFLKDKGYIVFGIDTLEIPNQNLKKYYNIDINDIEAVEKVIDNNDISCIYHLAAIANPRYCNEKPSAAFFVNVIGTYNLIEISRKRPYCRLLVIGSSKVYKQKKGDIIEYFEEDQIESYSIYGVSKKISEDIGRAYVSQYDSDICFTRSFNHSGPNQPADYVLSDFARQVALINLGKVPPIINVGNIDIERDFSDVRDVINAYYLIMEKGKRGNVYNVASGRSVSLGSVINTLISFTNNNNVQINIDKFRVRDNEPIKIIGNIDKLKSDTGFNSKYDIDRTLYDLFCYWKEVESK